MPSEFLGDFLWTALRRRSSFGLVGDTVRLTYDDVIAGAEAVAAFLAEHGCEQHDRIVLGIPSKVPYVVAVLGVFALNAAPVLVDVDATRAEDAKRILAETCPALLLLDGAGDAPDGWETVAAIEVAATTVTAYAPRDRSTIERQPDVAMISYSSGATGRPKGVLLSHDAQIESARAFAAAKHEYFSGLTGRKALRLGKILASKPRKMLAAARSLTFMTTLSLQGIAGHSVLVNAVLDGAPLVVPDKFVPSRALDMLASERVTALVSTPTMVDLMSRSPECAKERFSSLLLIGLGAEPASPGLIRRMREAFDAMVLVGYGSTELGGGFLATRMTDSDEVTDTTVGFVMGRGHIRILSPDGTPTPRGEIGELYCRTTRMMTAYADGSAVPTVDGGWYATGDLATYGPNGSVRIIGRADDVLTRNGRKFATSDVEEALRRHPDIADAGVIGVRRDTREDAAAFVVPREPRRAFTRTEVIKFLRDELPAFVLPTVVFTVDQLPRSRDGKLARQQLVAMVEDRRTATAAR
jgi:acyl-CoA synthetase (AMP-forming)/AMP-acid ligase II